MSTCHMVYHKLPQRSFLELRDALIYILPIKQFQLFLPLCLISVIFIASRGNLSAQTNPVYVGTASSYGTTRDVVVSGDYAYAANYDGGLQIYNVSNPTNPIISGNVDLDLGSYVYGVTLVEPYAYLAGMFGLEIFDVSNPTNPIVVTQNVGPAAHAVSVSGNYAYVAEDNYGGLAIYDISNRAHPVLLSSTNSYFGSSFGFNAIDIAVSSNYAYLVDQGVGLRIFDVSNKSKPLLLGQTNVTNGVLGIALAGKYAYLACYSDGLRIVDISNPAKPIVVGHINTSTPGSYTRGVTVSGNYAYLANDHDGMSIYDVSDPANPIQVAHADSGPQGHSIAISGNYAYMASRTQKLRIYFLGIPPTLQLKLEPTPTNTFSISWPAPSAAFSLQQSPDLNTSNWTTLSTVPSVVSNRNQVILPSSATNQFYRLKLP